MPAKNFYCVLLTFCCFALGNTFNLEYRLPVVKTGRPGSYFGYSVAEHQTFNDNNTTDNWLLVGAPKDQNLQPKTNRSGALWKCPLTSSLTDCEQVVTDGRRDPGGDYMKSIDSNFLNPPHNDEIKDGQWLGVSVRSQGSGGKVVVCAHRYIRKVGGSQLGQGLCYTLNNYLGYDDNFQSCQGRPTKKEHEEFGYCQVGTSSSFLEDGTLVLGSPGPYTWRGTLFVHDTIDNFLERDKQTYYGPVFDSPVDKYSYLGMSVAGGRFLSSNMAFVAGAPRANGTGQAVIFTKIGTQVIMNASFIINGEQFASNFGYELAAVDLNGDGKTDLVIGAPFYFDRDSGGSVYIYMNDNYSFKKTYTLKLTGKPESRFGFAISSTGDLNKDGCDDLAIGSPYEGNGVVYIYLGSRKNGLDKEPKQIIKAEMLPISMKTFGYSLSGGTDLDGNNYPDLLVGAYEQDSVVLLRARPIIDIKIILKNKEELNKIDPSKYGCPNDPYSNRTCFSFEICCDIEALPKLTRVDTLALNYVIEAETFSGAKKFSRVFFGGVHNGSLMRI